METKQKLEKRLQKDIQAKVIGYCPPDEIILKSYDTVFIIRGPGDIRSFKTLGIKKGDTITFNYMTCETTAKVVSGLIISVEKGEV